MKIYAVEVNTMPFLPMLERLPFDIQIQINRFRKREDALKKLYSELMIRKLIKEMLCIKDEDINICKNLYGKPFLDGHPNFHYNISHSASFAICAIANSPIGIDIEQITKIDLDVATEYFTQQEINYIFNCPFSEQRNAFFELWTLKESYIKQIGMGLSINLNDFSMIKSNFEWHVVSDLYGTNLFFHQYNFMNQYEIAVCSETNNFPENIIFLHAEDFF